MTVANVMYLITSCNGNERWLNWQRMCANLEQQLLGCKPKHLFRRSQWLFQRPGFEPSIVFVSLCLWVSNIALSKPTPLSNDLSMTYKESYESEDVACRVGCTFGGSPLLESSLEVKVLDVSMPESLVAESWDPCRSHSHRTVAQSWAICESLALWWIAARGKVWLPSWPSNLTVFFLLSVNLLLSVESSQP